jgi:hypothetical protein
MDEGSKRKLITQLNNWIMKKETIEWLKNKNIQILTLAQDANLGEIVEVLLAHYTQNNILLPNWITNNQWLITSLIELPSPIPTVQAWVQRKVRELTPQT